MAKAEACEDHRPIIPYEPYGYALPDRQPVLQYIANLSFNTATVREPVALLMMERCPIPDRQKGSPSSPCELGIVRPLPRQYDIEERAC
ncbi:hypothetical protein AMTR_s00124p00094020 [Amborella trichopoda]|uniref:Uncharacterized protein n=1 Tax=Amborella trichopoda TaxID=13333 RepID=W1NPX1_AMBTC|nr:hypothetical protein AMTR_s00124p00094020 [Amborella trichopoda]